MQNVTEMRPREIAIRRDEDERDSLSFQIQMQIQKHSNGTKLHCWAVI